MAESVDAEASKAFAGNGVRVRVPLRARKFSGEIERKAREPTSGTERLGWR
jgi:hypothetical protein